MTPDRSPGPFSIPNPLIPLSTGSRLEPYASGDVMGRLSSSSPRTWIKTSFWLSLILVQMIGCARFYRPITVAPAPVQAASGEVRPSIGFQPWGDNSRYRDRAREEGLWMMVLTVANGSDRVVQVSLDTRTTSGEWVSPARAHALIRQSRFGYALYPAGSLVLFPPGQTGAWSGMANAASGISFGITLTIGLSNAAVATSSNRKLEAFFMQNAWSDGEIRGGGNRQGLLWFRPYALRPPAILRLKIVDAGGAHVLDLALPEDPIP